MSFRLADLDSNLTKTGFNPVYTRANASGLIISQAPMALSVESSNMVIISL